MEKEFRKLFSGLLQDAGEKADEGKTLVKNAIHKITGAPKAETEKATPSSRKEPAVVKKPAQAARAPSAFKQNLQKLKQYGDDLPEAEDVPVTTFLSTAVDDEPKVSLSTAPKKEGMRSAGINPKATPAKQESVERNRVRQETFSPPKAQQEIKPEPFDTPLAYKMEEITEETEAEKQKLINKIANWQQALSESMGQTVSPLEEKTKHDEALVERMQAVLDLIGSQIGQIQAKKSEQEAQKLLFDSTCATLNQEREAYRHSIESLARQVSQKHEELAEYLIRWEEDSSVWTKRKAEIEQLRQGVVKEQQHYQQSISDYVGQLEDRQQTLSEYQETFVEKRQEIEKWLIEINLVTQSATETQAHYRKQIADYIEQLRNKQAELEQYISGWNSRLSDWKNQAEELQNDRQQWEKSLTETKQVAQEIQHTVRQTQQQMAEELQRQQSSYQAWFSQQETDFETKKQALVTQKEETSQQIELLMQKMKGQQANLTQEIDQKIQAQQAYFDDKQSQLTALANQQIDLLTEQLAQSNELYLTLYREHQQQLSDILANKPDIVTESVWRNRLSYAVTFLPRLPVYVSPEDLSVLFGGIEVQFKSPYVPPAESTIQVKWQLFQKMPEKEKETITLLCREMAANYRIEFHPIVRLLEG